MLFYRTAFRVEILGAFHEKAFVYIPRKEESIRLLNCNLPSILCGYGKKKKNNLLP